MDGHLDENIYVLQFKLKRKFINFFILAFSAILVKTLQVRSPVYVVNINYLLSLLFAASGGSVDPLNGTYFALQQGN